MEPYERKEWAASLKYGDPTKLPEHFIAAFECFRRMTLDLHSTQTVNRADFPVVALIAELLHERDVKIADLEARLTALEPTKTVSVSVADETPPDPELPKMDLRTKAGRAMKAEMAGAT